MSNEDDRIVAEKVGEVERVERARVFLIPTDSDERIIKPPTGPTLCKNLNKAYVGCGGSTAEGFARFRK